MKLNIGENIKRLRREKGMTQEQLAELLNITSAAVSKWEKGDTYPDITAIIPLARIFEVRVDDIMGYDSSLEDSRIEDILTKHSQLSFDGKFAEATEHITRARKSYPNDYRIMHYYMWDIAGGSADNDPDILNAHSEEFTKICDILLSACVDEDIRLAAITMKAKLLHATKQTEKALDILTQLPNWYSTSGQKSEQLFAKGTPEYLYWVRRNMYELADGMIFKMIRSIWYTDELSTEEKIARCEKIGDGLSALHALSGEQAFCVMAHTAYCELHAKLLCFTERQSDIDRITEKRLIEAKNITEATKNDRILSETVAKTYGPHDFKGDLLAWEVNYLTTSSHLAHAKAREKESYMAVLKKYSK